MTFIKTALEFPSFGGVPAGRGGYYPYFLIPLYLGPFLLEKEVTLNRSNTKIQLSISNSL
jgi:hypothetical protein